MEIEIVTLAARCTASGGHSHTSHVIIPADSTNLLTEVTRRIGSPDWHVTMSSSFRRLLYVYCPRHAGVTGNNRAYRLAGKGTIKSGLRLDRSQVLRSLRQYLLARSVLHTHTHTHTHTHILTRTHAHTRTHTHTKTHSLRERDSS